MAVEGGTLLRRTGLTITSGLPDGVSRKYEVRQPQARKTSPGNQARDLALPHTTKFLEIVMLRGGLLWLIGIPLPIIIILWLLGYLH